MCTANTSASGWFSSPREASYASAGPTVNCEWHYSLPYVPTVQGHQSSVSDTTLYPMYKQRRANSHLWVTLLSTLCTNSAGLPVICEWHYSLPYVQTAQGQQSSVSDTSLYPMYKQRRANSHLWVTLLSTLCTNSAGPPVTCEWHYSLPYVQTVQGHQSTVSDTTLYPMYKQCRANSQLWVTLLSTLCTNSAGPTVNCEWHYSLPYVQTVQGHQSTVSDTTLYPMYKQRRANSQLWVTLVSALCTNSAGPPVICERHCRATSLYTMYKQCRANSHLWVTLVSTLCTNSAGPPVNCEWH